MSPSKTGRRDAAVSRCFVHALGRLALSAAICGQGCSVVVAQTRSGPTVADVVGFTRIVAPAADDADSFRPLVSPDGRRAFVVTRKADIEAGRNRYEILLLDLRPDRLAAGRPDAPVSVARIEPVLDNDSAQPAVQDPRWVGERSIVFRARLPGATMQAFRLDAQTRRLTQLTHAATDVVAFAVSDDLRTVVYTAQHPNPPLAPGQRSVVVGNRSFWSVKFGQHDMNSQLRQYRTWAVRAGGPPRPLGPVFDEGSTRRPVVNVSPDGRWALLPRYEPARQAAWSAQYPLVAEATRDVGPALVMDPLSYFVRPARYVPKRLVAYRLADGREQAVIDAPDDALGETRLAALWQGGGRSVVLGGQHLPAGAPARSSASHVVEYWPASGRWTVVTALTGRLVSLVRVDGGVDLFEATDAAGTRRFLREADGSWRDLGPVGPAAPTASGGWRLRLHEDLDVPPDIVAEGPDGRRVPLTRLNPQVSRAWGTVRSLRWHDRQGRQWDGGLLLPDGFEAGRRHPLVIQTYGFTGGRFYLDGSNESIALTSGFAGRAFLREGILVLAFPIRATTDAPRTERGANAAFMDGVRGAIDALVQEGLVDRDRVGLMGWSMTGEQVLNHVTFSDVPIRAATLLDGDANTLFSLAVTYAASDDIQARKERTNGALPFGESLADWVHADPSLHTDCITAALRIETYGPWVLNNWDLHALLRRQYKAAEMVVIPGGSHGLLTPGERMDSLLGNVDWYRFWLKGEERARPAWSGESAQALAEQYRRWRQMVDLKAADDARPRCARRAVAGQSTP